MSDTSVKWVLWIVGIVVLIWFLTGVTDTDGHGERCQGNDGTIYGACSNF